MGPCQDFNLHESCCCRSSFTFCNNNKKKLIIYSILFYKYIEKKRLAGRAKLQPLKKTTNQPNITTHRSIRSKPLPDPYKHKFCTLMQWSTKSMQINTLIKIDYNIHFGTLNKNQSLLEYFKIIKIKIWQINIQAHFILLYVWFHTQNHPNKIIHVNQSIRENINE